MDKLRVCADGGLVGGTPAYAAAVSITDDLRTRRGSLFKSRFESEIGGLPDGLDWIVELGGSFGGTVLVALRPWESPVVAGLVRFKCRLSNLRWDRRPMAEWIELCFDSTGLVILQGEFVFSKVLGDLLELIFEIRVRIARTLDFRFQDSSRSRSRSRCKTEFLCFLDFAFDHLRCKNFYKSHCFGTLLI
jgi:hypothetical protein